MPEFQNLDINVQDFNGLTPLISIIITRPNKYLEIIEIMLDLGADPFLMSNDGLNSFHWATRIGNKNILELLIKDLPGPKIHRMLNTPTGNEFRLKPIFLAARFDQVSPFELFLSLEQRNRKSCVHTTYPADENGEKKYNKL